LEILPLIVIAKSQLKKIGRFKEHQLEKGRKNQKNFHLMQFPAR
jgi:hypothetical protein